ncbi:DUF4397 domain-containing protein [Subtercola vilae]|uniref:DUF4397 domain-containing protein n=1 Tax=Subtercola vilae TaxID=2056433 RepID=A0A4T2C6A8_9MICO|nr:DUF4397 domain-containing protein [Subtercola vilae]TIH39319.1 DUF4397 domain-containing protein [Subtercola vilae]
MTSVHENRSTWSKVAAATVAVSAGLLLTVFGASSAQAATAAPQAASQAASQSAAPVAAAANTGWIRLAHLSPDTKAVDIQLTALSGGQVLESLTNVIYGQVSDYMALPQGTYVVAMVPAGGDMAHPLIQTSINVTQGQPMTVAAIGTNAKLTTAVFPDDLTTPTDGQSRVRVIQASTTVPSVSIATSAGAVIATDAKEGTATNYASVPAGPWNLALTGAGAAASTTQITLGAGTVSSLFVLDNASGGVTIKSVTDAASVGAALPTGGIQTGGGWAAEHVAGATGARVSDTVGLALSGSMLAALALAILLVRRSNRLATGGK